MAYTNTTIFLTKGLCVVYHSLTQYFTLMYPEWARNLEVFCLLVTTHIGCGPLLGGTLSGLPYHYSSPTAASSSQGSLKYMWGKGQSKVPCCCLPGWHIQWPLRGIYHSTQQCGTTRSTSLTMHTSATASVLQEHMV